MQQIASNKQWKCKGLDIINRIKDYDLLFSGYTYIKMFENQRDYFKNNFMIRDGQIDFRVDKLQLNKE